MYQSYWKLCYLLFSDTIMEGLKSHLKDAGKSPGQIKPILMTILRVLAKVCEIKNKATLHIRHLVEAKNEEIGRYYSWCMMIQVQMTVQLQVLMMTTLTISISMVHIPVPATTAYRYFSSSASRKSRLDEIIKYFAWCFTLLRSGFLFYGEKFIIYFIFRNFFHLESMKI